MEKEYKPIPYKSKLIFVDKDKQNWHIGDTVFTSNIPIEVIKGIDKEYSTQEGYEWLITVESSGNQYKPCEIFGKIVAQEEGLDIPGVPFVEIEIKHGKFIITSEMREMERQVMQGEISYSRMIEMLNEKAIRYIIGNNFSKEQIAMFEKNITDGTKSDKWAEIFKESMQYAHRKLLSISPVMENNCQHADACVCTPENKDCIFYIEANNPITYQKDNQTFIKVRYNYESSNG